MWWIIYIISACILGYLVYHFGLCTIIIEAFEFTATYAKTIIGACLGTLINGVSWCLTEAVNWFIGLFK